MATSTPPPQVKYHTAEDKAFSFWDYGGQPEFHLGHHDHLATTRTPSVYIIVAAATRGRAECMRHVRYWQRFIAAVLPNASDAVVALVVSRSDVLGAGATTELAKELQATANRELQGAGLPRVAGAFALDCRKRGGVSSLREWLVSQHTAILDAAQPVPRACEAIEACKPAWLQHGRTLSWTDFTRRCRNEASLPRADDTLLRTAACYMHDAGVFVALDHPEAASQIVVLDPGWLCNLVVGQLLAPEELHVDPALRKPLLTAAELEHLTGAAAYFGADAGRTLGQLLCGLGLCFAVGDADSAEPSVVAENRGFFLPALLTAKRPKELLLKPRAGTQGDDMRRAGRRLIATSADVMFVPGFFARLQVRAAEEPSFTAERDFERQLWVDGLLRQRGAAQAVVERFVLADGLEGVDVIARCGPSAQPLDMVLECMALVRQTLGECCAGVETRVEEHAIGRTSLELDCTAQERRTKRLVALEAEQREGHSETIIGGERFSLIELLGAPQAEQREGHGETAIGGERLNLAELHGAQARNTHHSNRAQPCPSTRRLLLTSWCHVCAAASCGPAAPHLHFIRGGPGRAHVCNAARQLPRARPGCVQSGHGHGCAGRRQQGAHAGSRAKLCAVARNHLERRPALQVAVVPCGDSRRNGGGRARDPGVQRRRRVTARREGCHRRPGGWLEPGRGALFARAVLLQGADRGGGLDAARRRGVYSPQGYCGACEGASATRPNGGRW